MTAAVGQGRGTGGDPSAASPLLGKKPREIARMFDAIAGRYDLLNHLLSGGLDLYWRARAVGALQLTGHEVVLDLCTGTCDLALGLCRRGRARRVVGVDFSAEMLRVGLGKVRAKREERRVPLLRGDAMRIPLADASVDAVTMAFGLRNVEVPATALAEVARVLRPGGRIAILEFGAPRMPVVRSLYFWYFRHVLPRIGRLVSRHRNAYTYLPASVDAFVPPEEVAAAIESQGLSAVRIVQLSLGVVYMYAAAKLTAEPRAA
ncbi:MAG: bifunctional demethylmenaquinone methyltransferase/2-methoxy-6-polyprenyl-1,4-benzoquinol methylase UbiE [Luteitalea sp.]|nr:bifunctional demethylmenaquinone methyltransferase/2-methoxy-6-polyprenyl-1,4-benzoquinol methylase UbiE [Luteitalea sp.]